MQRRKQSDPPRHGPHPDQTRKQIAINFIPITLRCSAPSEFRQERCQNAGVMPAVAVTYRAMPAGRQSRRSFCLSMIVSQIGIVQWVQAFWGCLTSDDVEGPESCPRLHVLISSTSFSATVIAGSQSSHTRVVISGTRLFDQGSDAITFLCYMSTLVEWMRYIFAALKIPRCNSPPNANAKSQYPRTLKPSPSISYFLCISTQLEDSTQQTSPCQRRSGHIHTLLLVSGSALQRSVAQSMLRSSRW